jgi:cysteine-rich repeat protein
MHSPKTLIRLSLSLLATLALPACDPCPQPVPGWTTRPISVVEMREELAKYSDADARDCWESGTQCAPAGIGIDERNGLPVYIRLHCDDICPDYARWYVTYGEEYNQACPLRGLCTLQAGAMPGRTLACLPFAQGYSQCDGVCGDGQADWVEACDDGNLIDGDGCSSTCTLDATP